MAMITAEQVTKARELLGWSVVDLARWSGVSRMSVFQFELEHAHLEDFEVAKIKTALEQRGIEFPEDGPPRRAFRRATWEPPPQR